MTVNELTKLVSDALEKNETLNTEGVEIIDWQIMVVYQKGEETNIIQI